MRIAFFGLPLAALLLHHDGHDLVLVASCRSDALGLRRARRLFADRLLIRPSVHDGQLVQWAERMKADLLVSWFWTTKLPMDLLQACPLGAIGVHPSLLPRHQGPDPYFWAIESGDHETGVTAHLLAEEYDTGEILAQRRLPIDRTWNAWQLARALDRPSLSLLREVVRQFAQGTPPPRRPQPMHLATRAPLPGEDLVFLNFHDSTEQILRRIRALAPAPGALMDLGATLVTVIRADHAPRCPLVLLPGEAALVESTLVIRTGDGAITLLEGEVEGEPLAGKLLAERLWEELH